MKYYLQLTTAEYVQAHLHTPGIWAKLWHKDVILRSVETSQTAIPNQQWCDMVAMKPFE